MWRSPRPGEETRGSKPGSDSGLGSRRITGSSCQLPVTTSSLGRVRLSLVERKKRESGSGGVGGGGGGLHAPAAFGQVGDEGAEDRYLCAPARGEAQKSYC